MKKTFKKLLALFLTGTMLAGVGCKDYDDDIDNLQKEIDDLKGQIELKADKSAFESLKQKIDAIDFDSFLTAEDLAGYVTEDKLGTELSELLAGTEFNNKVVEIVKGLGYKTQEEIEAIVEGMLPEALDKEDIIAIFNEQIAAADTWTSLLPKVQEAIKNELASYELNDSQQKQAVNAVLAAITDKEDALGVRKAIADLLGEEFGTYMEDYIDSNWSTYAANVNKAVEEKLNDANSTLTTKIKSMISESINSSIEEGALKTVFDEYDKQIAAIWSAIGDLASRIQSLVYVPENARGYAFFRGATLGDYKLTEGKKATLTFRVSPASLASQIAEGYNAEEKTVDLAFLPEKVELVTRAEEAIYFNIEGKVESKDGKISMVVNTNYPYDKLAENETYSIALQVISESKATVDEDTEIETGVEYTSAYLPTMADPDAIDVADQIVLAKEVGEGETKSYVKYNDKAEYSLVYNDITTQVTLLGDYKFVFEDGDELISLADAAEKYNWDIVPAEKPAIERTNFTNGATELALTPENPMEAVNEFATIGIKEAAPVSNIDKTVSEQGKLFVEVEVEGETKQVENGTYEAVLSITRKSLGTIDNINGTIDWVYFSQAYETNQGYAFQFNLSEPIFIDKENKVLSKEQFDGIKASLADAEWTIEIDETSDETFKALNTYMEVKATAISDPYIGTDSKVLQYTIKNYKNGNGKINVSTKITVNDNEEVTLKGVITFNGLPDMSYEVNVPNGIMDINEGQNNIWVMVEKDFYATMFEKLGKEQTYFKDQATFEEFMRQSKLFSVDQEADAQQHIAKAGLRQNGTVLRSFFKMNTVDFNAADSYTYTVPEDSYYGVPATTPIFKINLSGSVTINKEQGYYLGIGTNLYTDKEPYYMIARGKVENNQFKTEQVQLTSGYGKMVPEGSDATATVTYKVLPVENYTGNMPTIDGSTSGTTGILDWNGCQLDAVQIEATMVVNGLTIDTKVFNVELQKPINFSEWTFTGSKNAEINKEVTANVYEIINSSTDGSKVKDIFGTKLVSATGLAANVNNAAYYGMTMTLGEPKYESANEEVVTFENFSYDPDTATITYAANNAPLVYDVTVTIPVTFTYKYAIEFTGAAYEPVEFPSTVVVTFKSNK